jgi:hypothetical protein
VCVCVCVQPNPIQPNSITSIPFLEIASHLRDILAEILFIAHTPIQSNPIQSTLFYLYGTNSNPTQGPKPNRRIRAEALQSTPYSCVACLSRYSEFRASAVKPRLSLLSCCTLFVSVRNVHAHRICRLYISLTPQIPAVSNYRIHDEVLINYSRTKLGIPNLESPSDGKT